MNKPQVIDRHEFNTNNAWGFGGGIGTHTSWDNGFICRKGRAYYRHLPPSSFTDYYVMAEPDFQLKVRGSIEDGDVHLYAEKDRDENGGSYRAFFGSKTKFEDYLGEMELLRIIAVPEELKKK